MTESHHFSGVTVLTTLDQLRVGESILIIGRGFELRTVKIQ